MATVDAATIFNDTQFQAFGDDGSPVALGTVLFTRSDNGAEVDTYKTGQRTAMNTRPVVLSASGKADIYVDNGLYDVVVKDSNGLTVRTIEDFSPALSSTEDIESILAPSEWVTPVGTPAYVSASSFQTDGDTTGKYIVKRRLKINLGASIIYSEVETSSYTAGTDKTTVVIADTGIDLTLVDVEHSVVSPYRGGSGGSLSYYTQDEADESFLSSEIDLSVIHNIIHDLDYTLTAEQNLYGRIEITDTNTILTADIDIITDNKEHTFLFVNSTLWTLTVKTSAGTGIEVPAGEAYELRNDTVNIIKFEGTISDMMSTGAEAQTKTGDLGVVGDVTVGEIISISSWSYVGTAITLNLAVLHNLSVGQYFSVSGLVADTNAPNGRWVVATVVDTDTITFTAIDTPTGTPTVSSAELSHGDIKAFGDIETDGKFVGKNACTAWVDIDGNATPPTNRGNFNVADVVRTATGVFDIYFDEDMDNVNYTVSSLASMDSGDSTPKLPLYQTGDTKSISMVTIKVESPTGTRDNIANIFLQFVGGKD